MTIKFILALKVRAYYSLNSIYSGRHWSRRASIAKEIHSLIRLEIKARGLKRDIEKPCELWLYYNSKLDCSNHGFLTKCIEDGMKGLLIKDDTRKYIKGIYQGFWNGEGVKVKIKEIK